MRFYNKKNIPEIFNVGDLKYITNFALFPTRINEETVIWLERYINVYEYSIIDEEPFYQMSNISRCIYGFKLKERKIYEKI